MEDDVAGKHPTEKPNAGNGFPDREFFSGNGKYRAAIVDEMRMLPCRISSRLAVREAAIGLHLLAQRLANGNPDCDHQVQIAALLIGSLSEDLMKGVDLHPSEVEAHHG